MLLDFNLRPLPSIFFTQEELAVDSFKLFDSLFPLLPHSRALTEFPSLSEIHNIFTSSYLVIQEGI